MLPKGEDRMGHCCLRTACSAFALFAQTCLSQCFQGMCAWVAGCVGVGRWGSGKVRNFSLEEKGKLLKTQK